MTKYDEIYDEIYDEPLDFGIWGSKCIQMLQLRLFCSCEAIDFSIANEGSVTSTEEVRCTVEIS